MPENINRQEVFIPCGTLMLEGILEMPAGQNGPCPAGVVCHPHPLYGGNMHNAVVRGVRNGLLDMGTACLRFNFRGTGGSWGTHGGGVDELEDVIAALDFLQQQSGIDGDKLLIAGYSFGCWVGLGAAARDARPKMLIGISPPLDVMDFSFLMEEKRPKLLLVGDRDFVCSMSNFNALVDKIPPPKKSVVFPYTDHFHMGKEQKLADETAAFLREYPFDRGVSRG